MKPKNAGFFQLHVEKIILGIGAVVLLGVGGYYIVGNPYAVEIDNRDRTAPEQYEEPVRQSAERLQQNLNSDEPLFEQSETPQYAQLFEEQFRSPTAPDVRLAVPMEEPGLDSEIMPQQTARRYEVPAPPAPTDIQVRADNAMLGQFADMDSDMMMMGSNPSMGAGMGGSSRTGSMGMGSSRMSGNFSPFEEQEGEQQMTPEDLRQQVLSLIQAQEPPYDFRYVSIAGTFNMTQWLQSLRSAPSEQRVPRQWQLPAITSVYLERQKRDPETGEWGEATVVDPLPHQLAYVPRQGRDWDAEGAWLARQRLAQNQRYVRRPPFVPVAQADWQPPGEGRPELSQQEERELLRHNETIQRLIDQAERMQRRGGEGIPPDRLEQIQQQWQRAWSNRLELLGMARVQPPEPPQFPSADGRGGSSRPPQQMQRGGSRGGPPSRRGPGAGSRRQMGGAGGGRSQRDAARERSRRQSEMGRQRGGDRGMDRRRQQREMEDRPRRQQEQRRRQQMEEQQRQQRQQQPQQQQQQTAGGYGQQEAPQATGRWGLQSPDEPSSIRVWAHDMSVEPGATYRYRLVVSVFNPLFQRFAVEPEQREQYFHQIGLTPDFSQTRNGGWTEPIRVSPNRQMFMLSGRPSSKEASIEVWRLYQAQWHKKEFDEQAGNPIGGMAEVEVLGGDQQGRQGRFGGGMGMGPGGFGGQQQQPTEQVDMNSQAVLVDVIETEAEGFGDTTRMLYREEGDEDLQSRSREEDRDNPKRVQLRNERFELVFEQRFGNLDDRRGMGPQGPGMFGPSGGGMGPQGPMGGGSQPPPGY